MIFQSLAAATHHSRIACGTLSWSGNVGSPAWSSRCPPDAKVYIQKSHIWSEPLEMSMYSGYSLMPFCLIVSACLRSSSRLVGGLLKPASLIIFSLYAKTSKSV